MCIQSGWTRGGYYVSVLNKINIRKDLLESSRDDDSVKSMLCSSQHGVTPADMMCGIWYSIGIWYIIWHDMARHYIWYDMIWYHMLYYMIWYVMIYYMMWYIWYNVWNNINNWYDQKVQLQFPEDDEYYCKYLYHVYLYYGSKFSIRTLQCLSELQGLIVFIHNRHILNLWTLDIQINYHPAKPKLALMMSVDVINVFYHTYLRT